MNLNDSRSLGTLTEADLDEAQAQRSPAPRVPRIPRGLDYQGRYPMEFMPAEACTDIGADDAPRAGEGAGVLLWPLGVIAAVAIVAFLALVL